MTPEIDSSGPLVTGSCVKVNVESSVGSNVGDKVLASPAKGSESAGTLDM